MANIDPKFQVNLAWAFSRHLLFQDCRRAYWYEYVATYDRDLDPTLRNKLWKLRALSNKRFLRGSLVHNAISEFLSHSAKERPMGEAELHQHLLQNIERWRRTARDMMAEYYNGLPVDQDFFDRLRTEGQEQLSMFLRVLWPPLSRLEYEQHEKPESFSFENVPVRVKVDLVSRSPEGRVFVIDWKTGADDERYQSDLQIGTYALWAAHKFGKNPSEIATDLYYLRSGKTVSLTATPAQLENVGATIKAEFQEFQRAVSMSENPPSPESDRCLACKYATVCEAADLSGVRR